MKTTEEIRKDFEYTMSESTNGCYLYAVVDIKLYYGEERCNQIICIGLDWGDLEYMNFDDKVFQCVSDIDEFCNLLHEQEDSDFIITDVKSFEINEEEVKLATYFKL